MIWTFEIFIIINFIIIISSILQMATGVSVGIIIVPFLAMISYTLIPAPIIFASLTLTIMMAYKGKNHIDTKNTHQIAIGMLTGIFISIFILNRIQFDHLGLIFGIFILISVFISLKIKELKLGKTINYAGGLMAGIMGTMAAVGGQILALIFQNHKIESIKATLAFLYTLFSITMLCIFYFFDKFNFLQMKSGFYMMPGFIIGFFISPIFSKHFNPKYSKASVLLMASLGAVILIFKSMH